MFRITMISLLLAFTGYSQVRTPVLVELFTSEGCSSCPPADNLMADLARTQPVSNADVVVLSEHVDYWNSLGWKDPFSSAMFSERQQAYASRLGGSEVYTPQVVVDGRIAVVGSRRQDIWRAVASAGVKVKPELAIRSSIEAGLVSIEVAGAGKGDLWVAIAQNKAVSRILRGENGGRTLEHVYVVRILERLRDGKAQIAVGKSWGLELSAVAFVQDAHSGRILQVTRKAI